jgi:hypothetical protein
MRLHWQEQRSELGAYLQKLVTFDAVYERTNIGLNALDKSRWILRHNSYGRIRICNVLTVA